MNDLNQTQTSASTRLKGYYHHWFILTGLMLLSMIGVAITDGFGKGRSLFSTYSSDFPNPLSYFRITVLIFKVY